MWRHFHCNVPTEDNYNKDILEMNDDNDGDMIQEDGIDMERIQLDQEEISNDDRNEEEEMDEDEDAFSSNDKK